MIAKRSIILLCLIFFSCNKIKEDGHQEIYKFYPDSQKVEVILNKITKTVKADSIYIFADTLIRIYNPIEDGFKIRCTSKNIGNSPEIILKAGNWQYKAYYLGQ